MKNYKSLLFVALTFVSLSSCTKEDTYEIPPIKQVIFQEDFSGNTDGTILDRSEERRVGKECRL